MESRESLRSRIIKAIYSTHHKSMTVEQIVEVTSINKDTIEEQLEILEDQGHVELFKGDDTIFEAELTAKGKQYAVEGRQTSNPTLAYNVQNTIGEGNTGPITVVGIAQNSPVSQIVNDPQQLQTFVQEQCDALLEAVKSELSVAELRKYFETVNELREELLSPEPDPSTLHRIFGAASFLATAEGNIALATRVVPLLVPLLDAASKLVQ